MIYNSEQSNSCGDTLVKQDYKTYNNEVEQ